jgi:O-antigen/teichoic acid export membrane protein
LNRQFLILLAGRISQSLLAIASIRLMTSLIDKENVGYNYLIISIISYFSLILINPVGVYLNRHIHEWHRHRILRHRLTQITGYFLLIAMVSVPAVIICFKFLGVGRGIPLSSLTALVAVYVFFSSWALTLYTNLNMLEHRVAFVCLGLVAQATGIFFAVLFVTTITQTAVGWLLGILVGQVFAGAMAWWYYKAKVFLEHQGQIESSALFKKDLAVFCVPIAITTVFMWTQNHSYRLLIEPSLGPEFLASLAVGLGIANSLSAVIESLVIQYFHPGYFAASANPDVNARISAWNSFFKNSISIFIPYMVFCLVSAKFLMFFLVAEQFRNTFPVLMFGLGLELLRMISNVAYVVSFSEKKTKTTIVPYMLGATSLLGLLSLILMDWLPGEKTTLILTALLLAGAITCVSMFISVRRILNIHIDLNFLFRTAAYCAPLAAAFFFIRLDLNFFSMLTLCGISGSYALLVIWGLQKSIKIRVHETK